MIKEERQKVNENQYEDAKKRMWEKIHRKAKEIVELGGGSVRFVCKEG